MCSTTDDPPAAVDDLTDMVLEEGDRLDITEDAVDVYPVTISPPRTDTDQDGWGVRVSVEFGLQSYGFELEVPEDEDDIDHLLPVVQDLTEDLAFMIASDAIEPYQDGDV